VLYGYLYGLLRAEDHSLLMGAAGLSVILALVMHLTRKLDWWTLSFRFSEAGQPPGS
jgi:inner membrane protein